MPYVTFARKLNISVCKQSERRKNSCIVKQKPKTIDDQKRETETETEAERNRRKNLGGGGGNQRKEIGGIDWAS